MEKTALVYKRRPRKPLTDVQSNAPDDHEDPASQAPPGKSADGSENRNKSTTTGRRREKSWMDRSLSNKGRRSSVSRGEAFNVFDIPIKWVEALKERRIEGSLQDRLMKHPPLVSRRKVVNPPIEFVKEKQAMFAEIDSFELESEEESPASKFKRRYSEQVPEVSSPLGCSSEQLPNGNCEYFSDYLSAVLRTPNFILNSRGGHNALGSSIHNNADVTKRLGPGSIYYSALISSFNVDAASKNDIHNSELLCDSSHRSSSIEAASSWERADERKSLSICDDLVSQLKGLQVPDNGWIKGSLNSLEEENDQEVSADPQEREDLNDATELRKSGERFTGGQIQDLLIPIFDALLEECHQTGPSTLRDAISKFCALDKLKKVGEGLFGEAFRGGGCVFKIVPMNGDFLVNGEAQKTSAEIYSEVLVTKTLNRLRQLDSNDISHGCSNFIETKAICICQGRYEKELISAWEAWDVLRASENDHPMLFPEHQLYVVFVLADGGTDLESFVLSNFSEAKSVLLQVVLALGVAEKACGFEHRDLHWGNLVLIKDEDNKFGQYRLRDKGLRIKTEGLSVSIIDFTLSRIDTGNHVFFCNLSADTTLFEGPARDTQADTYRRMLSVSKGNWEASFPQTNGYWIHYLADILLKKKAFRCSVQEKRALRSFSKRVLLYESAEATISDDFFQDLWIEGP